MKKKFAAFLLTTVMVLGCTACGSKTPAEPPQNAGTPPTVESTGPLAEAEAAAAASGCKTLTIYTASNEDEFLLYATPFEEKYGIQVEYVRLSQGELTSRVEAEAGNPQASLVMGITDDSYIALTNNGLLESYQSPLLSEIPDDFKLDVDGVDGSAWNPYFANVYVIACNTDWFEENNVDYPATWDDLLDPVYEGAITIPHPSTSGVGLFALNFMLQSRGEDAAWKYFEDLNKNIRQYSKGSSAAMMGVSLGEAALTITGPSETLSAQNEGYPVYMDVLDDLNGFSFSGISIIKGAPEAEDANAKLFIDWMLSVEGQKYVADAYRSPINVNATAADGMPVIPELNLFTIDPIVASEGKEDNINYFMDYICNTENLKA